MNTNNIIETKLIEIISSAQAVGADVYAVVQREAPELAREVVLGVAIESASYVVIWGVIVLVLNTIARKVQKKYPQDKYGEPQGPTMTAYTISACAFLIFTAVCIKQTPTILKSIFTPRVVFMQELGKLSK